MVSRTLRIDEYTYNKIKVMADFYNMSVNSLIIELIQIGYLIKEKENLDEEI